MRRNIFRAGSAAVLVMLAMSACSSSGSSGTTAVPSVASLETDTPRASSPAPSTKQVRERIDMTNAEKQALQQPYLKCMTKHGADVMARRSAGKGPDTKSDAANAACESLLPLPAWELDPANPEAREFARAVRDCLKGKGVRYVEISDDGAGVSFGGKDNDAESIKLGLQYAPGCERDVATQTR